ncbi:MAG: hypothetical protein ACKPBA_10655 [Planctomycetota bacterium]
MTSRHPFQLAAGAALSIALVLAGCGNDPSTKPAANGGTDAVAAMVTKGAVDGVPVMQAKGRTAKGQEVSITGRIGGSEEPFASDRAVFTVVDASLKSCAEGGDPDHCATPWDYCCEDRQSLKMATATVEIADADGRPLPVAVRGTAGLDPLARVTVTGTVIDCNDRGLLVVRATRIAVH